MARCEVVQVQCDRCKRVELRAPAPPKTKPDFEAIMLGEKLTYPDLCEDCRVVLKRLMELFQEWDREIKQPFGPQVKSNEAPPLQVAPNYTPPQPHSAAAGRR